MIYPWDAGHTTHVSTMIRIAGITVWLMRWTHSVIAIILTALVQEGLECSSEAFLFLQMTSP